MLYVSQILSRPIFDLRNEQIAIINDVLVRYGDEEYPPVIGLVARYRRRNFFMPTRDISEIGLHGAKMTSAVLDLTPFIRRDGEVLRLGTAIGDLGRSSPWRGNGAGGKTPADVSAGLCMKGWPRSS